jgi:hypothetical protein
VTRWEIVPENEEGREPSSPVDRRARLPDRKRRGATRTELPNGTVLVSYDEPPLT